VARLVREPTVILVTIPQAFELALQHHRAGRLAEAGKLYQEILKVQPNHPGALHFLGVTAHQAGQHELAAQWICGAIALDPTNAAAHGHLGEAYRALGRLEEAITSYARALELNPESPEAHNNLGAAQIELGRMDAATVAIGRALQLNPDFAPAHFNLARVLTEQGRLEEAFAAYRRALDLRPNWPEAHLNVGIVLRRQGLPEAAAGAYRRALEFRADWPEALNNLGNALRDQGLLEDAAAAYRRAIDFKPDYAEAHSNLAVTLADQGQVEGAVAACRRAIGLQPSHPEAHMNLGNALAIQGRLDEALEEYHRALKLQPDHPKTHINVGNALKSQGRLDDALAAYRRAIQLHPDDAGAHSNLIYALHFQPRQENSAISEEHASWNRRFSDPVKQCIRPHGNDHRPERRLRIGYVSADLRDHVVGRNLLPLFRCHDHRDFEILCYSGVMKPDEMTGELRRHVDGWRSTVGLTDERLDEVIRRDGVDILVDLSQHTGGNRLPLFARCPAPVQVSFAGYPESAGVEAIGYRISDRYLEAGASEFPSAGPGQAPNRSSEIGSARPPNLPSSISQSEPALSLSKGPAERVFLIDSFWCYDSCGAEMEVHALPAQENGCVTFGSLNNFCKINDPVLKLWARVLGKVKDSRLILLSGPGSHWQRTLEFLQGEGIEPHRVKSEQPRPRREYLELYHRLDLVLDTFPYNGHTTSLDALWMGAPVVSLAGERPVSRAGQSQLSNLGLGELVAFSEDDFVQVAAGLARDLPRLAELRATLRSRMEASVLMDAPRFTRQIEAAFHAMWRRWCAEKRS